MIITQNVRTEMKKAMLAKDTLRLTVLRGLLAGFGTEALAKGKKSEEELTDEEALAIIKRAVKQRKDSIDQFTKGNRLDLVDNEKAELQIVEAFLPPMMSQEEIKKIALAKKAELKVTDKAGLGKFMGLLMKELKGQADGADVKIVVEELFK